MIEFSFSKSVVLALSPVVVSYTSYFVSASNKKFFKIKATIEFGFSLKCLYNIIRTYSQMYRRGKY